MKDRLAARTFCVLALCASSALAAGQFPFVEVDKMRNEGRGERAQAQLSWVIAKAVERSSDVREKRRQGNAARLDVQESEGAKYPQIDFSAQSRWSQGLSGGASSNDELNGRPSYSLNLALPVFDAGRIERVIDSKSATLNAQEARLQGAVLSAAGDAVLASIELARVRAQIACADLYLKRIQELADMLSKITREDPGRLGELTQARSRVLQAELNRASLLTRAEQARVLFEKWVGPTEAEVDLLGLAFIEMPKIDAALEGLNHHPAVLESIYAVQAEQNSARAIEAAQAPQVSFVASRSPVSPGLSGDYANYAGVALSYTAFKGYAGQAASRAAVERALGARERQDQVAMDRMTIVRALHAVAGAQLKRAADYAQMLNESNAVRRDFFEQWYQLGRRSLFELLASESEHYSLQAGYLDTLHDAFSALARLRIESGGFAAEIDVPARPSERR